MVIFVVFVFLIAIGTNTIQSEVPAYAATTIVVNSTADTTANDGECTLREAIVAANTDTASGVAIGECAAGSGSDTIVFSITEPADFTVLDRNSVLQNGYTISPTSPLPYFTSPVTVDGYSQPGALSNNAVSPLPLNGTLLIEVDGTNAGISSSGIEFDTGSSNSSIRGLIVNNFANIGISVSGVDNVTVAGNYVGTDNTGLIAQGNGNPSGGSPVGVSIGLSGSANDSTTTNNILGGLSPDDRNLISGNHGGGAGITGINTTVLGNYFGIASDGLTALPNSSNAGDASGGITIDYAIGVQIGGTSIGAMNVFSGNDNAGISPFESQDITVEGNYFGLGYDGTTIVPNNSGFSCGACTNVVIGGTTPQARNVFSGNINSGLNFDDNSTDITILGNYMGLDASGNIAKPNNVGLSLMDTSDVEVGNGSPAGRNVIAGNLEKNIQFGLLNSLAGVTNSFVQGNYIGINASGNIDATFDNGVGILIEGPSQGNLIGGTTAGTGNIIAGNKGGILVANYILDALPATFVPTKNAILGNSIYSNEGVPPLADLTTGLGIDLLELTELGFPPDGFDTSFENGVTANDATDVDTGPNGYMNFPVITSALQSGTSLSIMFNLEADDSPTDEYRVEFFANDVAHSSGHGEGQRFLGFIDTSNGNALNANLTLPSGFSMAGKSLSATATAIDGTTNSGFGSTSEFSAFIAPVVSAEVISAPNPNVGSSAGNLPITGFDASFIVVTAWLIIAGLGLHLLSNPKRSKVLWVKTR